jgi:hypothetical protein
MNDHLRKQMDNLWSADRDQQYASFIFIQETTEKPVDWAYDVWDEVVQALHHKDNHNRAIAAQILCNLAKSDPDQRILSDFNVLFAVTKDERFVTARHCLLTLWKVGCTGPEQKQMLVTSLAGRFNECASEKNCTLIRYDIIQSLKQLYDAIKDETVKEKALALIETENDLNYRKKFTGVWKKRKPN